MNTNVPAPLDGEEKESVVERLEGQISEVMDDLLLQYGANPSEVDMGSKLDAIMIIIGALSPGLEGGVGALRGLDILDIGCGSVETAKEERPSEPRHFEPWMARFLQSVEARVVGIDIGDLSKERFRGYSIDLSKFDALNFLSSSSFDIVHMRSLLDKDAPSPELEGTLARNMNRRDYEGRAEYMISMMEMDVEIRKQALRLLREGGVFIYNRKAYKKVGGVFIEHLTGME